MSLYDLPVDVVAKALRGLGIDAARAASQAGLSVDELRAIGRDGARSDIEDRLAPVLGLDARALAGLRDYRPEIPRCEGLEQLELPFEDEFVNVWALGKEGTWLVIDAGFGPLDLAAALDARGIDRFHLLLTHGHRDHVGGVAAVRRRLDSFHGPPAGGAAATVSPGDRLHLGPFEVEVRDLRGHHPQAVGYRIAGLPQPVMAVGDAVFAGSMGGCPHPDAYRQAMQTVARSVLPLPAETILLTGHGPGTTLAQELEHNPFLAGKQRSPGN